MKKPLISTLTLIAICGVMAILLALVNGLTAPIIKENENAAAFDSLLTVMPNGEGFAAVDLANYTLPPSVTAAYKEAGGGFVLQMNVTGYSPNMILLCGVNPDGTVSGATCLSSGETLGYEKTYGENFPGKNAEEVAAVDTVAGATRTTEAYRSAVKDALNAAILLGGGDVDIRTPEEILRDNLKAALPDGDGAFTKLFLAEALAADGVYLADNGSGAVLVFGDVFVGVKDGNVISEVDDATKMLALADMKVLDDSSLTEVDLSLYEGIHKNITSVRKTVSGNFVFEVKGAGYGIVGGDDYHPASGEYILIRVSMTPAGEILDCLTLYEAETDGIGSVCGESAFYSQFVGKTQETYNDIDGIAGATMTTDGYKKAILRAFEALTVLKGGSEA